MTNDTKEAFALNLILCRTVKEAAQKTGISQSAATRLRKQETFQKYLHGLKERVYSDTMNRAQAMSMDALDTLQGVMQDKSCTASSRVAAARFLLELGMESYTKEKIIDEIEELKMSIKGREKACGDIQ